jgi:hypothetical protein
MQMGAASPDVWELSVDCGHWGGIGTVYDVGLIQSSCDQQQVYPPLTYCIA